MSGIELSLAILPLVLSSLDQFDRIIQPIKRFKKFDSKFKNFQGRLTVQKTIYRKEIWLLVKNALGFSMAEDLFNGNNYQNWSNDETSNQFLAYLDSSSEAYQYTFQEMDNLLKKMESETTRVAQKLADVSEIELSRLKSVPKAVVEKMRFTYSYSSLQENMSELRSLNQDLQTMVGLDEKIDIPTCAPLVNLKREKNHPAPVIETFQIIKNTSILVYETLGKSCSRHTRHDAHFSLAPLVQSDPATRISFDVGYRKTLPSNLDPSGNALWFSVESSLLNCSSLDRPVKVDVIPNETRAQENSPLAKLSQSPALRIQSVKSAFCRRDVDLKEEQAPSQKKKKKKVRIDDGREHEQPNWTAVSLSVELPDLLLRPDLCMYVLKHMTKQDCSTKECVGCLRRDSGCNLLVYTKNSVPQQQPSSLFDVLQSCKARRDLGRLTLVERARFARLLATATLQFHGTPWLKTGSWRSKALMLYDSQKENSSTGTRLKLSTPYVDVPVETGEELLGEDLTDNYERPWIRDPILYGLGIMLIEIAFQQPLQSLERKIDSRRRSSSLDLEFTIAERMVPLLCGKMGTRYGEVVGKCLYNFGFFNKDLSDYEMRQKYHSEVICELADLERDFARIDLKD